MTFAFGLIGMRIVDPATGAMHNLPDRVDISMDRSTSSMRSDTRRIATIDSLLPGHVAALVPLN
ncbi:MAG: hypothetical protein J5I92_08700 [Thiogranum sp.]|nr:hypothetical protein [Thiogranum sp.]